jgi:hypothetical protein
MSRPQARSRAHARRSPTAVPVWSNLNQKVDIISPAFDLEEEFDPLDGIRSQAISLHDEEPF